MSALQLVGILLWLLFPTVCCGIVAFGKERSVGLWVVLGFLFGAFALVVIALLPDKNKWQQIERSAPILEPAVAMREKYGKCPQCGRIGYTTDRSGAFYCHACQQEVHLVSVET
jgi:hypothetical protein